MSTVRGSRQRRGGPIHLLMLLVLWGGGANRARAAQSIGLESADRQLELLDRQLLNLLEASPPPEEFRQRLREIKSSLALNGGSSGPRISNHWIGGELEELIRLSASGGEEWRPRLSTLEYRLSRLRRLREPTRPSEPTGPRDRSPQAAQDRLAKILERPEYRPDEVRQSTLKRWWEEAGSALRDLLRRLLAGKPPLAPDQAGRGGAVSSIVSLLVIAALILFGVIKGWHLWQRRQRRPVSRAEPAPLEDRNGIAIETTTGPDDLRQQATQLAEAGEYREAIRLAYIASLLDLARREVMTIRPASSNRDYLDIVRENPAIFAALLKMTTIFEDFWYGENAATPSDYAELVELARLLDQAAAPIPGHV